jgi:hypothetical protein
MKEQCKFQNMAWKKKEEDARPKRAVIVGKRQ